MLAACVLVLATSVLLFGCTQPGTPIQEHQTRGLPEGFPHDFPLHIQFSVSEISRKLDWDKGDYFLVKFITDLKPHEIHYFFRKELATDRGYKLVRETGTTSGSGTLSFEKAGRHAEVTIGREEGINTVILRLKDRKERKK
jgi:hypothetical protein